MDNASSNSKNAHVPTGGLSSELYEDLISFMIEVCLFGQFLQDKETPSPLYMVNQKEITPKMRSILVDWLVEVVDDYELSFESLHLAINYLDRYLSVKTIPKIFLQLLGISCLLISSKFVEKEGMKIKDAVDVCSGGYTPEQVQYTIHFST